jgi:hypothetical protein
MKNIFLILIGSLLTLVSCVKEDVTPNPPNPPIPFYTDTTDVDSTISLKNSTWVITKVLNTNLSQEQRSDTLVFLTNNTYTFNANISTYHLYSNNLGYTLVLNNTVWGHLSGLVYDYNLTQGVIDNCQFKNYFTNEYTVKLWMIRQ